MPFIINQEAGEFIKSSITSPERDEWRVDVGCGERSSGVFETSIPTKSERSAGDIELGSVRSGGVKSSVTPVETDKPSSIDDADSNGVWAGDTQDGGGGFEEDERYFELRKHSTEVAY